ncbi:xanthine dehydrogenase [Niastella koreensis]|uniref:Xanthine and CO dehydrogenase maturation factor XdhC/CoxF family-like protein n=2 Tax=Niastella koreensis TaxID=354356 RepID=G8T6K4_NIAKG|nr:XdhC/CoxI family protein [Niastella koreensis]AEV96849.1 xanthine and CO dehydrogenase maturation factor XdhC/CoxF family-like protein [Niastella koreensis GR20-10]OQP49197.1 xanthine dehydrogenase [Niastella koreensis]
MKKQINIWQLINKSLQQQVPVMLLYVLQSEGSSPGRPGFFMAVNAAGETEGSIGGGIMEHKFIELAKDKLNTAQETLPDLKKQIHNKSAPANQSGMICSGEQTIWVYRVPASATTAIQQIIASLEQNKNGTLQLSPAGLQFTPNIPESDFYFSMTSETDWLYQEKTGYKNHLHIIGAGHCALALCRLMQSMEFYIHLYDDRSSLKTFTGNEYAHEKKIVSDYTELDELIAGGNHQYLVVMTVGYRTDDIVIRTLWEKQFRYVGMLGSKSKIEKMFTDYRAEGVPASLLQPIHAPIGIPIHSQTPEEIAISIAAEIIQVKNR